MSALAELLARVDSPDCTDDEIGAVLRLLVYETDLSTAAAGNIRLFLAADAYLDAVCALIPKRLGRGWLWQVKTGFACEAVIWCMGHDYDDDNAPYSGAPSAKHRTPAGALLAALLKAEIARSGKEGGR